VSPGEDAGARGGTPNLFALRPATTASSDALREQAVARALGLTAVAFALCLLALVINLRFPAPAPGTEPRGPLALASLPGGGLALLLDDALLLHARSGLPRRRVTAEALGLAALGAPLLPSADGSLLLRGRTADDPLWHLLRCRIDADVADAAECSRVMPIPAPPAPLGLRESYLGDVLFLQLDDGRLLRRSPRGDIDGEAAVPRPLAPAPMLYREGLLIIPQPDTPLLGIHRSDSGEFGAQLDAVFLLTPAGTAPTRRIVDVAAVGDDRYALLEDEAGVRQLYRFDANWGAPRRVALETEPAADAYLSSWRDRLLLASPTQRVQTRIAPGGRVEATFESPMLKDDHDAWKRATAQRELIRRLGLLAPHADRHAPPGAGWTTGRAGPGAAALPAGPGRPPRPDAGGDTLAAPARGPDPGCSQAGNDDPGHNPVCGNRRGARRCRRTGSMPATGLPRRHAGQHLAAAGLWWPSRSSRWRSDRRRP
jgi:hypothetical protein